MTPDEIQLNDPQTLYRRWEDSQWSPFAIDLSRDAEQWAALGDEVRGLLVFVLASLMVAEERITTKFSRRFTDTNNRTTKAINGITKSLRMCSARTAEADMGTDTTCAPMISPGFQPLPRQISMVCPVRSTRAVASV